MSQKVERATQLKEKREQLERFLARLQRKHPLPAGYTVDLCLVDSTTMPHPSKKGQLVLGLCDPRAEKAVITLAAKRLLADMSHTFAHEYKHILQVVYGCRFKRYGQAREAQADRFADMESPAFVQQLAADGHAETVTYLETKAFLDRCIAGA